MLKGYLNTVHISRCEIGMLVRKDQYQWEVQLKKICKTVCQGHLWAL